MEMSVTRKATLGGGGAASCRAEAPFHKRVHWASFVGQETVSLPKPDVELSR